MCSSNSDIPIPLELVDLVLSGPTLPTSETSLPHTLDTALDDLFHKP
jgi:hypothetical protein